MSATKKEPKRESGRVASGQHPLDPGTDSVNLEGYEIPYRTAPFFLVKKTVVYSEEEDELFLKTAKGDTYDVYNDDFYECDGEPEHPGLCRDERHELEGVGRDLIDGVVDYDPKKKIWFKMIHVPSAFYGAIIGPGGSTLKAIQNELDVKVTVPRRGTEGPIELVSYNASSGVQRALERIELIVLESRAKKPYSHFVAVPANQEHIMLKYVELRDRILGSADFPEDARIPELWYNPNKLHLTISMLCLLDKHEEKEAAAALSEAVERARDCLPRGKPLKVLLRGLDIMGDDPGHTAVLYAKARCDKLQAFANGVAAALLKTGFAPQKREWDNQATVKLHMTIANARKSDEAKKRIYGFDVTEILKQFGTYEFGHLSVSKVVINVLGRGKTDEYMSIYEKSIVPLS
ncbi:hypothetical protein QR680_012759 [Steinernema hermaphroditum]|uniref:K Homology domain-containing protein n=1 Tax=Steinernema hermaphroditum TaxID=289476 RepID=A0AA39I330_9BILA|nr:hypothetical protein QR680_012759 [Steinernema hermaphroditum]